MDLKYFCSSLNFESAFKTFNKSIAFHPPNSRQVADFLSLEFRGKFHPHVRVMAVGRRWFA